MRHATISITVVVLGDVDSLGRMGKAKADNEVDDAREAPPIDHLRILIHINTRVDRHARLEREGEVLSETTLDLARSIFGESELGSKSQRLDHRPLEEGNNGGGDRDGESVRNILGKELSGLVRPLLGGLVVPSLYHTMELAELIILRKLGKETVAHPIPN